MLLHVSNLKTAKIGNAEKDDVVLLRHYLCQSLYVVDG